MRPSACGAKGLLAERPYLRNPRKRQLHRRLMTTTVLSSRRSSSPICRRYASCFTACSRIALQISFAGSFFCSRSTRSICSRSCSCCRHKRHLKNGIVRLASTVRFYNSWQLRSWFVMRVSLHGARSALVAVALHLKRGFCDSPRCHPCCQRTILGIACIILFSGILNLLAVLPGPICKSRDRYQ